MPSYSVMVIDNEPFSLIWMQKLFHQPDLGFECSFTANNALEAMESLSSTIPDVIVSDIRMPYMSGLEFLHYLNEQNIPSRTILVSAYADFSYAQEALRAGAVDYLLKPITEADVRRALGKIAQLLHQAESAKQDDTLELLNGDDAYNMMLQYICLNYSRPIRLQDIADHVHLSANYCSTLFQKESGSPFSKYLTNFRLKKAKELLKMRNVPINRIAALVGYPDFFYFSKVFKQNFGVSPSEYRSSVQDSPKGHQDEK